MRLPEAFLNRMKRQLGEERYSAYLAAMNEAPKRSLRVNTLKCTAEEFLHLIAFDPVPNGIVPEGFLVPDGFAPGSHPLHASGAFYMQEASAQYPAPLLNVSPGEKVLDLCAAPGGKTGQLAQSMQNRGVLVANEIRPKRASVLDGTLERLGVRNALVTSMSPETLASRFPMQFDAVLVDAPCSGEGMFRRDPQAVADWSESHVLSCASRQKTILESASETVCPGGRLVYSTCTFSDAENEETVSGFLAAHPDFHLVSEKRLYPFDSAGEGQFAALLVRDPGSCPGSVFTVPQERQKHELRPFLAFLGDNALPAEASCFRLLPDGRVFILPEWIPDTEGLHILRSGVLAGEIRSGRFEPAHCLYMAYPASCFGSSVDLDGPELSMFLAGETIPVSGVASGYAAVCVCGHPVGYGKVSGGLLKNRLPKGLRIRKC